MKLSVVTVCFNSAKTIGYTLESFFRQTHADKELVIVDAASTDGTLNIVHAFAGENVRVLSERDKGLYDGMNKGLGLFTGEAVGFLNSDDRYQDDRVLADIAQGLADADIVCGNLDFVADHETGQVVRRWRGEPYQPGDFRRGWMPAHPTFYARRQVIEAVGRFDLSLPIAADYDFMLRAVEVCGYEPKFLDRVMVQMMAGGTSNSGLKAYLKSNLEALRARRRWLGSGLLDTALFAKPLRKLHQFVG
jgi:glycosyltransferase involved in cell wall biosynthesis